MTKESLVINGETLELDASKITLVFNTAFGRSHYSGRHMIDAEWSLAHFRSLVEIDGETATLFRKVVHDFPGDLQVTRETISQCEIGFQHLAGLISLSLHFARKKSAYGWKYPETGLHPKYQGNLADLLIHFSSIGG